MRSGVGGPPLFIIMEHTFNLLLVCADGSTRSFFCCLSLCVDLDSLDISYRFNGVVRKASYNYGYVKKILFAE